MLAELLQEASTLNSKVHKSRGWVDYASFSRERCYIGIRAPRSCIVVFSVLLLFHCVVFQVGETIRITLQRKDISWLFFEV
jgi:hypothetical protein